VVKLECVCGVVSTTVAAAATFNDATRTYKDFRSGEVFEVEKDFNHMRDVSSSASSVQFGENLETMSSGVGEVSSTTLQVCWSHKPVIFKLHSSANSTFAVKR